MWKFTSFISWKQNNNKLIWRNIFQVGENSRRANWLISFRSGDLKVGWIKFVLSKLLSKMSITHFQCCSQNFLTKILLNSFTENSEWLQYHKRITSQFLFTKCCSITSKILNSFAKHRRTYRLMRKLSKNIMGNYFKAFSIPLMIFSFFAGVST